MTEDADNPNAHRRLNAFLFNEDFWQAAAFIAGGLVACVAVIAALITLINQSGDALNRSVDTIYKLALIGVGVVTFCTVVWRGLISGRQANTQQRQIEKLAQQIEATEENNLAELLQKGAGLLASEKPSETSAGIAILQTVAEATNSKFSVYSMNLLASFVQDQGKHSHVAATVLDAIAAIEGTYRKTGRKSDRELVFSEYEFEGENYDDEYDCVWKPFLGVNNIRFYGGRVNNADVTGAGNYFFHKTRINHCKVSFTQTAFERCRFNRCVIKRIHASEPGSGTVLKRCNFSGAEIMMDEPFPDLRGNECWFSIHQPPVVVGGNYPEPQWTDVLGTDSPPYLTPFEHD